MTSLRARLAFAMAAIAAVVATGLAPTAAAKPARIVSLNMCTDELVLRLAAPERIASVTWLSRDPRNANMGEAARAVGINHGLVEEVLAARPDLVVAGAVYYRHAADDPARLVNDT
ncbi:hypothetical protein ACIPIA_13815, partial [Bosea sp. CER48]